MKGTGFIQKAVSTLLAIILFSGCFGIYVFADYEALSFVSDSYEAKEHLVNYVMTKEKLNNIACDYSWVSTYKYDKKGNKTKESDLLSSGKTAILLYKYDSKGNLIKKTFDDREEKIQTYNYTYDSNDNIIKERYKKSYNGIYIDDTRYRYDNNGYLIRSDSADVSGCYAPIITTYTNDKNGKLMKEVQIINTDEDSDNTAVVTYAYNKKGYLSKRTEKQYGSGSTTLFSYDNNGRLAKEIWMDSSNPSDLFVTTYLYNSDGFLIKKMEKKMNKNSNSSFYRDISSYAYNSKGNMTKMKNTGTFESSSYSSIITFTYDSNDCLIKQVARNETGATNSIVTYKYKKLDTPKCIIGDCIHFSNPRYIYDGKAKKPTVRFDFGIDGQELFKGLDYTVRYSNNINPGKAKAVISFKRLAHKPITIYFEILPAKTNGLKRTKATKSSVALTWEKVENAEEYIVYRYDPSAGKFRKAATVNQNKATIKSLNPGTSYTFCVRASSGGVKGICSETLTVKTKK